MWEKLSWRFWLRVSHEVVVHSQLGLHLKAGAIGITSKVAHSGDWQVGAGNWPGACFSQGRAFYQTS